MKNFKEIEVDNVSKLTTVELLQYRDTLSYHDNDLQYMLDKNIEEMYRLKAEQNKIKSEQTKVSFALSAVSYYLEEKL